MARVVASEWGKAWTVRSPGACLVGMVLATAVTALSLANDHVISTADGELPHVLVGVVIAAAPALQVGQLVFTAFALHLVCSEYTSGSISSTLLAEPRRGRVLLAKAAVAAGCGAVLGALVGAATDLGVAAVLGDLLAPGGTSPGWSAVRAGFLLAATGVLVVGAAAVLRSAVGTLAVATTVLVGTSALPDALGRWLPGQAGLAVLDPGTAPYPAVVGAVVLAGWSGAALVLGVVVMERRDA